MSEKPSRRVSEILPGVLKGLGVEEKLEEARLIEDWPEIVGEAVARRSRPRRIKGGLLFVGVDNSVWMQEIRFHQRGILGEIRRRFPRLGLKGIRLELDRERDEE